MPRSSNTWRKSKLRRSSSACPIAEVADAYLTLASDQELQQLAQETLKSQEDSFTLTQKRHDAGGASGLDLAQAQTTVESARVDLARFQGTVQTDIDALTLLAGAPLDTVLLPSGFESQVVGLNPLPAELPSAVLLRRPDVLSAEYTLRAANANIGAARAAFFPRISLTGDVGVASVLLSGLFKSGSQTWSFTPQATLPIFEGGQLFGNLAVARSEQAIALAQYEKTVQTGFREVADALALSGALVREHEAQQALVTATGRAYDLSQQRYRAGRDSYLNVLDSQRSNYLGAAGVDRGIASLNRAIVSVCTVPLARLAGAKPMIATATVAARAGAAPRSSGGRPCQCQRERILDAAGEVLHRERSFHARQGAVHRHCWSQRRTHLSLLRPQERHRPGYHRAPPRNRWLPAHRAIWPYPRISARRYWICSNTGVAATTPE